MPIVLEILQRRNGLLHMWYIFLPSLEQTEEIKNQSDIMSNPLFITKEGHTGERHGPTQWQYDHWKATDATTAVKKTET